jgi:hypothetical protein
VLRLRVQDLDGTEKLTLKVTKIVLVADQESNACFSDSQSPCSRGLDVPSR